MPGPDPWPPRAKWAIGHRIYNDFSMPGPDPQPLSAKWAIGHRIDNGSPDARPTPIVRPG
jgi:hypothetical protein